MFFPPLRCKADLRNRGRQPEWADGCIPTSRQDRMDSRPPLHHGLKLGQLSPNSGPVSRRNHRSNVEHQGAAADLSGDLSLNATTSNEGEALEWQSMLLDDSPTASHLRFAAKVARRYKGYGFPLADIVAEANLGLVVAATRASTASRSPRSCQRRASCCSCSC